MCGLHFLEGPVRLSSFAGSLNVSDAASLVASAARPLKPGEHLDDSRVASAFSAAPGLVCFDCRTKDALAVYASCITVRESLVLPSSGNQDVDAVLATHAVSHLSAEAEHRGMELSLHNGDSDAWNLAMGPRWKHYRTLTPERFAVAYRRACEMRASNHPAASGSRKLGEATQLPLSRLRSVMAWVPFEMFAFDEHGTWLVATKFKGGGSYRGETWSGSPSKWAVTTMDNQRWQSLLASKKN